MFISRIRRIARSLPARPLSIAAAALLALLFAAPAAQAAGTPNIAISTDGDHDVLYGDTAAIALTATNPAGQPVGYNLSLRAVLPVGVTYVPGSGPSGLQPQVINNAPAAGQQTVIFSNVSDLSANSSYRLPFRVAHDHTVLPLGATFNVAAEAYINSDARYVPQFTAGGVPVAQSPTTHTGWATTTHSVELLPFRVIREAPDNQLRGAHDFQYRTRIRIENNLVRTTENLHLDDYAPAGVEVLACGTGDNTTDAATNPGSVLEYPGSGPLNPGNAPALTDCVAPDLVSTLTADPDGPGGVASGVWTRQTWSNLGTLAIGGTMTIDFATAIPIRENTLTWSATEPTAASGDQAANLDNNDGDETYDEQALTSYAEVTGNPSGMAGYSASDTQTTIAEDLTLGKTASSPTISVGAITTWTLTARASEYRWVDDAVITDTVPDGLCPLGAVNYENIFNQETECDPTGPDPFDSVVENADGTYTVTFDALARIEPGDQQTVTFTTRTRSHYQNGFVDAGEVLAHDEWTNTATVEGDDFIICTGGADATDCAGNPKIDHDEADGDPDFDAASAEQVASAPTLDKQVSTSATATDCDTATYTNLSTEQYGSGDRVCWLVRMEFPDGTPTGNVRVTDFLPLGHSYEAASFHVTPDNTVTIDSFDTATPGLLLWELGDGGVADADQVFEGVLSTIVNEQASPAFPGQLTQNLLKASTTNTAETTFPLRDDAGVVIEAPVVTLNKSVVDVDGGAPSGSPPNVLPGDVVTYRVQVANTGERTASGVEVWDVLPTAFSCADVDTVALAAAPVPGTCSAGRIEWTVPSIAAGASRNLDYDLEVPVTGAARTFTNSAGVRTYHSTSNIGTTADYYPAGNIDPTVSGLENAAAAEDTQSVATPALTLSKGRTTEVNETGNTLAQATIGEQITYTVSFTVPAGVQLFGTAQLNDPLGTRQTYVPGSLTATMNGGALPGGVVASENANNIRLDFPTDHVALTDEAYVLTFSAQVDDDDPANRRTASGITNTATLSYNSAPGTPLAPTASSPSTALVEPNLQATKISGDADGIVEPGQEVAFTVGARNAAGSQVSLAHQVALVDTVPAGLTPLTTAGGGAAADGGTVGPDSGVWDATARTITWPAITSIAAGVTVNRTYSVRVDDPALSQAQLQNTVDATTSSLPAANEAGGERGSSTTAPGYAASADVTLDIVGMALTKNMTPATQTVGGVVNGTLTVTIPANIGLRDAYVTDTLPDGLVFDGYDAATCTSGCGPAVVPVTLPTQNAGAGRTRLGWWLGDVTAHTAARTLTLNYHAHVAATYPGATGNVQVGHVLTNTANWHLNRTDIVSGTPAAIPGSADVDSDDETDTTTVTEPHLTLDKDVSGDVDDDDLRTAQPGDAFTYSVVVTNTGNHPAHDVVVNDLPDSELVAVTPTTNAGLVTDGWTAGDRDLAWLIPGPIAPGDSVTLRYTAQLAASAQLSPASSAANTADVPSYRGISAAERLANGFAYRDYDDVTADTVTLDVDTPQVTIAKAATGGPSAWVGLSYAWTITLTNTATAATAHGADVTDVLPPNWTYDAGSATIGGVATEPSVTQDPAGDQLHWDDVADLAPGATATIAFTAKPLLAGVLTPGTGAGNPHVNHASVSGVTDNTGAGSDADGSYSGPATTAQTLLVVPTTDLGVVKTTTTPPVAGGAVAWQLTVTNHGPDGSPAVHVADTLPAGVTLTSAETSQGTCDTSGAPAIECELGAMGNGATATIDIEATVDDAASQGASLANTATVSDVAITDPNPVNDTDTTNDTILERSELTLQKALLDPLVPGRQARWQLTVANHGPSVARAVTITDQVPTGLTAISASPGCTVASPTVTCAAGDLAPGQVAGYTVITTVEATDGTLQNTATAATPTPGLDGGPNAPTAVAGAPVTRPDLALTQAIEGTPEVGSTVDVVLTTNNVGTAPTYGPVTVVAALPPGLTPLSAGGDGWMCTVAGQTVTCSRADILNPGGAYQGIRIAAKLGVAGTSLRVDARVGTAGDIVVENDDSQGSVLAGEAQASCSDGGKVLLDTSAMWAGVRHTVTGRVVAAGGRVVPGQSVRVLRPGSPALTRRTNAAGRFSFSYRPRSGAIRVRIEVPGCAGLRKTIAARRAPSCRAVTATPASLKARKATRVRIRLRVDGRAIGLARVHLRGAGVNETVRTGTDGRAIVRIRPTRAGILSVTASSVASCTRQLGVVEAATARQLTG